MRNHSVKDAIAEIKFAAISRAKFHTITQPFVCRQSGCRLCQCRAQINAEHTAREIAAARDRAGGDTGAAPRLGYVDLHGIQIVIQHLFERWMPASRFQSRDDDLQQRIVEPIGPRIGSLDVMPPSRHSVFFWDYSGSTVPSRSLIIT
jgi:hypothetical protein